MSHRFQFKKLKAAKCEKEPSCFWDMVDHPTEITAKQLAISLAYLGWGWRIVYLDVAVTVAGVDNNKNIRIFLFQSAFQWKRYKDD